ncbi:MAG: hypothetical protein HN474_07520 [Nitrospina sp.]|nr:hypothetical protein [Nitrospina sp.]
MRTSNGSKVVRELDTWLGLGRRAYARASCEQEFATECDHRGLSGSRTIGAKDCRLHGCSTWRPAICVHPASAYTLSNRCVASISAALCRGGACNCRSRRIF